MKLLVKFRKFKLDFLLKQINPHTQDKIHDIVLSLLKPNCYNKDNVLITSSWKYNCVFTTLRQYNQSMMKVTTLLKNNVVISPDWCRYDFKKVSYDDFFTDQYVYVDKVKELSEFIRLTRILRAEVVKIQDAQVGIEGHNYRQMSRFCTHLNDLIIQIIRCSYEISLSKSD